MAADPDPQDTQQSDAAVEALHRVIGGAAKSADRSKRRRSFGRGLARDMEGQYSGPGPDGRDPADLASAVEELVTERGWVSRRQVAAVLGRWDDVVGEQMAQHVSPLEYDESKRVLIVAASSSAWAANITMLLPTVIARLNEEAGAEVVVSLVVRGPSAPRAKNGWWRTRDSRGPRDTWG